MLNKSAAAVSGSFAPAVQFEKGEIHKVFLPFPNLRLSQNLSLPALADLFRAFPENAEQIGCGGSTVLFPVDSFCITQRKMFTKQ
ncbi:MAG: hypothetical protein IJN53_01850 [Oscillospiraceae bacterium]|nr:hypothetical protein [Oscillospiraceae bacterium]